MKKWLLSLLFFLAIILPKSHSQTPQFKNITVDDGLLSSTVYCVYQDTKGFIWFATNNGVNRYDGKSFENFSIENGLSDNEVLKIKEDSKGRIWFLTFNGKLSYYLNGVIYNSRNSSLLKKAVCHSNFVNFYEDANHTLWFSSNVSEVMAIKGNNIRYYFTDNHKFVLSNVSFFENEDNQLWSLNNVKFQRVNFKGFKTIKQNYYPLDANCVYFDKPSHTLYFLSKVGLIALKNNKQKIILKIPSKILEKGISSIAVIRNKLWITFLGNGILQFDFHHSKPTKYLENKLISSLEIDMDDNLWVTTLNEGVYLFSKNTANFTHYTHKNPLSGTAVLSIEKDSNNHIWLGFNDGIVNLINKNSFKAIDLNLSPLSFNPIKRIKYSQLTQDVWFMSEKAFGRLNPNYTPAQQKENIKNFDVSLKTFTVSEDKKIAIATSTGLYIFKRNNSNYKLRLKELKIKDQNLRKRTYSVRYDRNSNLWIAQTNGLFILDNKGKTHKFSSHHAVLRDRINYLYNDDHNLMYAATASHGVAIFKNNKLIKVITQKDGLNSNNCFKTYVIGNQLWVTTSKGVNKIENPLGQIKSSSYTVENGLLTNEVNDFLIDGNFIYLASNKGLTKIDNTKQFNDYNNLPFYFKKFLVNGKEMKITNNLIRLSPSENNIQISYTAINFEEPNKIIYAYKINDVDDWIETPNNTLEFASLKPGNYQIQIRARDLNGNWGKSIRLKMNIEEPFYESFIFIILLLFGLAFLISSFYNTYTKNRRTKEHQRLIQKNKIIALEQQALQAMMNPHFIFNVMNSIQFFINTENKKTANQLLSGFARLIRKNLEIVNKGEVTLEEELEYITLYLQLESLRFGDRLNYNILIDDSIDKEDILIPSMLLQPYIENAIWHGIMPKEGEGEINLKISAENQFLKIIVEDNGIGIEYSLKTKVDGYISRGMSITKERIQLMNKLSGNEINIQINQRKEGGTQVQIIIPI